MFFMGLGIGLLAAAFTWRHTYRSPDRRHGLLTRRRWRDRDTTGLPSIITKD